MKCPFCGAEDTQVIDSRVSEEGDSIRRRRRCQVCSKRFTTYETAELRMPQIVKGNGQREDFSSTKLRTGFQRALHKRALSHFGGRLAHYTGRLELDTPKLALSSAHTRWGSCSKHGGIRLNWRLIHLPAHLGDYVVAHEVAHMLEMNHSERFWNVVSSVYPDWKAARAELKQRATSMPIL